MGSYVFKWPHDGNEVYVTGTFDDWSKSQKLDKTDNGFEKNVQLSKADEKILYKFVVDGNWTTDLTAPSENDHEGNANNVLTPDRIILSSVAPSSTTTALAGQVPLEEKTASNELPGQFPETPANESQKFSVNPIPATAGASNPIILAPGEKVPEPSSFTTSTLTSNVKLDKESYEKSGSAVPTLPPVLNKQEQAEADGAAIFGVPPVSSSIIPESSLPMGKQTGKDVTDPTFSSTGPQSTTAELAGKQPIEPRGVPEVVKDSQKSADAAPEASASAEAVQEKADVEQEIKNTVPEAPATTESGVFGNSEQGYLGAAAAGVVAAGAAATGAAYAAYDKIAGGKTAEEPVLPASVQDTADKLTPSKPTEPTTTDAKVNGVPEVVVESQKEAHADPEASSSAEAVKEKAAVEKELAKTVKPTQETGESAPTDNAALSAFAAVKATDETTPSPDSRSNAGRTLEVSPAGGAGDGPSRDVSPMTRPGEPSAAPKPVETTVSGGASPSTPQKNRTSGFFKRTPESSSKNTTAASDTASPSSDAKKKNNRKSFFGKLKEKLKS